MLKFSLSRNSMTSNRSGVMYRLYRILYGGPFLPKETPDSRHKLPNHDTTPQFTTPVASRPLAYLRSGLGPTLNMPSPARSGLVRSGQVCLCCITCFRNQTLITSVNAEQKRGCGALEARRGCPVWRQCKSNGKYFRRLKSRTSFQSLQRRLSAGCSCIRQIDFRIRHQC